MKNMLLLIVAFCLSVIVKAQDVNEYIEAAKQGDADAQAILGAMYYDGNGLPQDCLESRKWFEKSAEQGNAIGQWGLGFLLYSGCGTKQDLEEAVKWFQLGKEQQLAKATCALFLYYFI